MRVLMLNYEFPPLGGGAGVATAALARQLAAGGARVDVVTAGIPTPADRGTHLTVHRLAVRRTAVHQAGLRDATSYLVAALPVVRRLLRTHQYDVVHIFFSLPSGALLPLLDFGDTPVVVSLRGSDVPGYDPHNRKLARAHRLLRPLTRWIWRRADRVVALSESLGQRALETLPTLDYSVIHNGVELGRFHPPRSPRPVRLDRVRCIAVARLVERKGVGDLLRAFALLERGRYELEIVGSGPDQAALRSLALQLGLGREVRFLGSLDRDAVARRYRQADLFTLVSWEESFGNVFAEALASGLPIVGSRTGGIPEFVEHGRNGLLVPPRTPEAIASAIGHLADEPLLRLAIGARNRAKAESTLTWEHVASQYIEVYDRVRRPVTAPVTVAPIPASRVAT
ncbi:MAG: glycosyltransferase [Gemmatimonadales bacterium]|nr:glycosyltransferase [Gemmatimonadales bacterium]